MAEREWFDGRPGVVTLGETFGKHSPFAAILGLQAGCDVQFGYFVAGVQADYGWTDAHDGHRNRLVTAWGHRGKIDSVGTATARLGFAFDRFLGYVKGGYAWENDKYEIYQVATNLTLAEASVTRTGWVAGFGGEMMIFPNVSAFIEGNFFSFGKPAPSSSSRAAGLSRPTSRPNSTWRAPASTGGSAAHRSSPSTEARLRRDDGGRNRPSPVPAVLAIGAAAVTLRPRPVLVDLARAAAIPGTDAAARGQSPQAIVERRRHAGLVRRIAEIAQAPVFGRPRAAGSQQAGQDEHSSQRKYSHRSDSSLRSPALPI